eukprot:CAMPEP_0119097080 /NCGR_PEP_ID=MMETSP1178-20130426/174956_1 /TAXON_ID=33656 /ORGANISM="unid sp, Strain CCMP2000" /LENGTH=92 /DNA_ID=CAMNT_0007080997 /DNA_START=333 /DNA_END=607 /DNA_ORIENTATION=+
MIDVKIDSAPLSTQACEEAVASDAAGGTVVFIGTVRNQTKGKPVVKLDFEAYEPMAVKEMQKIAEQVTEKWKAIHVAIHHRVGSLRIGEVPV